VPLGTTINAKVFIVNASSEVVLYTSPEFQLPSFGESWYTSPSFQFAVAPYNHYFAVIIIDQPAYSYYNIDGNSNGVISAYSENGYFTGSSFDSINVQCCGGANIHMQLSYEVLTPPPPPPQYTFTSGDATYSNLRLGYYAAGLSFVSSSAITITQVSQYFAPVAGSPIQAMVIIADMEQSTIVYNSEVFNLPYNGTGWYTSPTMSYGIVPYINYSIGIMLSVSNTIFYSAGNTYDSPITGYAQNANFPGNFLNQTIQCCYSANIYTTLTYTQNFDTSISVIDTVA